MIFHEQRSLRLSPLLKWPGGKETEMDYFLPLTPKHCTSYWEPFVGGGAVFLATKEHIPCHINDLSTNLMALYSAVAVGDPTFFLTLKSIVTAWDDLQGMAEITCYDTDIDMWVQNRKERLGSLFRIDPTLMLYQTAKNLKSKVLRMKKLESQLGDLSEQDRIANIECALKSALYMSYRHVYNTVKDASNSVSAAWFFFLREYCYASMFRFNSKGDFNVPYGGISYNRKSLDSKIQHMQDPKVQEKFQQAYKTNTDFLTFLRLGVPDKDSFVFLDPPYDSDFSAYDKNPFTIQDHARLATYLKSELQGRFMLVIKDTPAIQTLYSWATKTTFEKTYAWTIKGRNNREAEHLIITNY